jgi:hypothetical protein
VTEGWERSGSKRILASNKTTVPVTVVPCVEPALSLKEVPELEIFNFIKDDLIQEGDGQVASGSEFLPDPVTLETEEQRLEREPQNEHDVLGGHRDKKSDAGMSVETHDVSALVT